MCEVCTPPLSSVALAGRRIGYEAAAALDRMMNGEAPPKQPIKIPPHGVISRQSTDILAIDDDTVVRALRFIQQRAFQDIVVKDILHEVPVSRRSLEIQFRRYLADLLRRRYAASGWRRGASCSRERICRLARLPRLAALRTGLALASRSASALARRRWRTGSSLRGVDDCLELIGNFLTVDEIRFPAVDGIRAGHDDGFPLHRSAIGRRRRFFVEALNKLRGEIGA
jgi:hypothetical protein